MAQQSSWAGQRATRILLGVGALTVLAALLVGVPLLLLAAWRHLGPPLPSAQELTAPDDGTLFVRVLCLIGWLGWVTFAWSVLAEIAAQVLGWRLPTLRWQRRAAAGLVAAVALAVSSPAIASGTAAPVGAVPAVAAPAVLGPPVHAPPAPAFNAARTADRNAGAVVAVAGFIEHRVQAGEQMPALAERHLGDKYRWHAIAAATYGLPQPDGRTLQPGDTRVYPGWIVRIPVTSGGSDTVVPVAHTSAVQPAAAPVYAVAPGDWMWHIADRFLGDPKRYTEIEALNPDLERRDGRFPNHIEASWQLTLPADAHDRGARPHAAGNLLTAAPPPTTGPATGGTPTPSGPPPNAGPGTAPSTGPSTQPSTRPSASPSPSTSTNSSAAPSAARSAVASPNVVAPSGATSPAPNGGAPTQHTTGPATHDSAAANGHEPGEDDSMLDQALLIGVPLLGAGLLAALLLTTLRRSRRRQEQHRPVGRRLPTPVKPQAETQLRVVAQPIAVERLDHALRVLAAGLADRPAQQMPDIVGGWLYGDTLNLLLTRPCPDPPQPWTGDHLNWTLPGNLALPDVDGQLAPLPTLAAVGSHPGMHLLLDLERLGLLAITGDPRRAGDLLRYLAAELATNGWSDHVEITVAGFDAAETADLIAIGGDRIDAAATIGTAIDRIRRRASQVVQSLDHLGADDPLVGRVADIAADAWMPQILLAKDPGPDDIAALEALDNDLAATGRCAVAVAVTTTRPLGRWPIAIDADGQLTVPFLGMAKDDNLTAAGLPRTELTNLADLLETARRTASTSNDTGSPNTGSSDTDRATAWPPVPAAPEPEPWAQGTDAAGALLSASAEASRVTPHESPPDSCLQADAETPNNEPSDAEGPDNFVADAQADESEVGGSAGASEPSPPLPGAADDSDPSNTVDEAARIPVVVSLSDRDGSPRKRLTAPVRRRHSDPTLDVDVRAWTDSDPARPRIAILGPVTVEAPGQPPRERPRFYAEIIVYLAVRGARGATTDQFDEALWPGQQPKASSRRVAIARARKWLGETPAGRPWLSDATADRQYSVCTGYLLDWHLFRRLRSRGESRGPAGAADLRQALALVRGEPLAGADIAYSPVARNPYTWLPDSEIQPHHIASAVVDTAHRLVDLCLDGGDITGARWAVDQAWLADPARSSDIAWRDLLRVAAAEGNTAELGHILGDLMQAREAEVPEDLDKETYRLLCDLMPERMRAGAR